MSSPELRTIHFSDTTLRDGEQMPHAALTPDQKVVLARALAELGVASIDAGFPACAPSEIEGIQRIVREVDGPMISALCRTTRGDIDLAWEALSEAKPDRRSVSLFVGTSPLHREHKLGRGTAGLVDMVRSTIEYARQRFAVVAFSPEDASRTEPDVLSEIYREAIDAGARVVGFTDTVGVLTPAGVRRAVRQIQDSVPNIGKARLAGHFHNDLGLATANALAAIEEGINIVQGTITGIGERAGNTALEELAMVLSLHGAELGLRTTIRLDRLWQVSRLVSDLTGIPLAPHKPVVGRNVFATEAGIHQDGLLKHPDTYLPFRPERVGAPGIELVLGKHSGRAAFEARLTELGYTIDKDQLERVVAYAKDAPKDDWRDEAALLFRAVSSTAIRNNQPHVRYSAQTYDDYTTKAVRVFDEMMAARVLEAMEGRAPDAVLLDIGTGTARLLVHLAGLAPLQRLRFVGTDAFEDMIDRARQTVDAAGLSNRIEVRVDDVHAMRLDDAFADVVISRSTVHHWSDPARAFREIYRVLKPGGIAIVHDVRRDPAPEAIAEFNRQRAAAGLPPSHLDEKLTVAEVAARLRDAGLEGVSRAKGATKGIGALGYEVVIEKPLS